MMLTDIYEYLDQLAISYECIDHPAVYTSEQARALVPERGAATAKNLFLRDKKGKRHFLAVFDDAKKIDFERLAEQVGVGRLSLASPARLDALLGIQPGAVSLLALVNDPNHKVQLLVDRDLWDEESLQCHPLVNTATLVIAMPDLKRFLEHIGHPAKLVEIP